MNNAPLYDLLGIGIGPFNLSLAALLSPIDKLKVKFCDIKPNFQWHPELMFEDATMQTSFFKDLVTPIDPTNYYSFLNYLVTRGQFYHFLNTSRNSITRMEFEDYCRWASEGLGESLDFNSKIENILFQKDRFKVIKSDGEYLTKNLCIASGPIKNIPECAKSYLGSNVFHAKSKELKDLNLKNKRVLIVGGGQTGIETFRNALNEKWGKAQSLEIITGRENLQQLDEGAFTNELFTPNFVSNFHSLKQNTKDSFTQKVLLASDGNTPDYLQALYNELYLDKFYNKKYCSYKISPMRWLTKMAKVDGFYNTQVQNKLSGSIESKDVDIIILATGFCTKLPSFMESLKDRIACDESARPIVKRDYKLDCDFGDNQIFAMNYSRHGHGIADPQTSLMSWRSSVIVNSLVGYEYYSSDKSNSSFLNYFEEKN